MKTGNPAACKYVGEIMRLGNISNCIDKTRKRLLECKIHLISLLPVKKTDHPKINHDTVSSRSNPGIIKVNKSLEQVALQKGIVYIDMYSRLADESGNLAIPCTRERLHLSPRGYEIFAETLKPYLKT